MYTQAQACRRSLNTSVKIDISESLETASPRHSQTDFFVVTHVQSFVLVLEDRSNSYW